MFGDFKIESAILEWVLNHARTILFFIISTRLKECDVNQDWRGQKKNFQFDVLKTK